MIKLAHPDITEREIRAVNQVLRSGTLSLGPQAAAFERLFARRVGRKHAIALNSGTSALHLIVKALGLGPGDEVVTAPYSFIASVNCILYEGARPVLADIDPVTLNIDPSQVERRITRKTRAVLAVDVFGLPADYAALDDICRRRRLMMIEDACEALGARYRGRPAGSFGRAAAFGFYPNKQITTGEGGMAVCDDPKLADLIRSFRNQGRSYMGGWLAHHRMGYNYRMSEINAAMGRVQLLRLDAMLRVRRKVAERYRRLFRQRLPEFTVLPDIPGAERSWFVFVILVPPGLRGAGRDRLLVGLRKKGIECAHYFPALHLQPVLKRLGYRRGDFPVAEDVADRSLAIPFHHRLTEVDQMKVVRAIERLS